MTTQARAAGSPSPPATRSSWAALPTSGWARLLRVAGFGTASLLLAGLAHLLGGGRLPGPGLVLVLTAVAGTIAAALTARRCRLPLLATVLAAEQVLLHALFAAAGPMHCTTVAAMPPSHLGLPGCAPGVVAATVAPAAQHSGSLVLLCAHAVATALTAWLLARGEAALWRLAERVVRAALPPRSRDRAAATPPRSSAPSTAAPGRLRLAEAAPRGPPILETVALG